MSSANGNQPDPDELDFSGNESQFEDLDLPGTDAQDSLGDFGAAEGGDPLASFGEMAEEAQPMQAEEVGDEAAAALEAESLVDEEPVEPEPSKKPKKAPREGIGMAGLGVFGFCGLSVLLLLALDAMVFKNWGFLFMLLMNVFWLMATAIPFIMWMGRKTLSFYEVALGIALAGIIVAVSLLLVELVRYGGEVTPKRAASASAAQLGSERINAVA